MAHLERSAACLRITGDSLIPEKITTMLGHPPTYAQIKGETLISKKTGSTRIALFGMWQLEANESKPEDLDGQIGEILGKLTADLDVWSKIGEQFDMDFFCGLFMGKSNEGLSLSPNTLAAIGLRGIELDLDIYGPDELLNDS
jgi:hypothetical protein